MPQITKGYDFDDIDPVRRVVTANKLEQLVELAEITFENADQEIFKDLAAASGTNGTDNHKFTGAGIADDTLGDAHLMVDAVSATKIQDGAVIDGKLAADSVNLANMKTNSVGTDEIIDANVTAAKLATDSVTTGKISANNVTTAKIDMPGVATALAGNGLTATNGVLSRSTGWQFLSTPYLAVSQFVNPGGGFGGPFLTSNSVTVAGVGSIPSQPRYIMYAAHIHQGDLYAWTYLTDNLGLGNKVVLNGGDGNGTESVFILPLMQVPIDCQDSATAANIGPMETAGKIPTSTTHSNLVPVNEQRFTWAVDNEDSTGSNCVYLKVLAYME